MIFYEINLLISPELGEEEAIAFVQKLHEELQPHGKIESEAKPERKKLAYPILGQEDAWFYFLNLHPEEEIDKKEMLDSVEKIIKENKNILRSLFIKKDSKIKKQKKKRTPKNKTIEITTKKKADLENIDEKLEEILGE